ncbi:tudor domain-containing protein 5 isoform X2 [Numida meleagris]|uniref:tudor domain-containing protein 5 isoform X2 n=1 Tax=Numida meleagris TaxID=8996 RepID=UPI000B3DA7F7|nr:tudor domain-containing protein 5 isoform X2 [Numida meleagris]
MSQQAQLMEVVKKEVRSQLLAAKNGLTPAQLEQEYLAMVSRPLPLRDLGFCSTMELVASMPGVVQVCPNGKGRILLKAVVDETTKDISELISRQKSSGKTRSAARKERAFSSQNQQGLPPKGKTPVLPAAVKRELQDLLSSSPLLLLDFNNAYYKRFKRTFQYTQYGFFSISEVFESVSDIITVKQTRGGSLITLKKNSSSEIEQEKMLQVLTPELPPLEPTCETEIFHQAAEEKSEAVNAQAVDLSDGLKQPQDFVQPELLQMMVTPEIPPDAVQDRKLCSLPPLERRCMVGVTVNLIVSPSEFYIHVCSAETSDKLWDLMIEMRCCYSNKLVSDRYIMPESSVQPGQLCCVMFLQWWYRAIIRRVINDQDVEVFYPDYGNVGIVQKSWLRFLKWCYLKLPAQAIPCSLAWVKPTEGMWTSEATQQFQELCYSKVLVGIVDEYVNDVLHLFLCDTSSEEDVYIHSVLRDKGYADICKENIASQGFKELNPSALYVQPGAKQESAELVEPDLCLQQDSLGADNEASSSRLDEDKLCNQMGIWLCYNRDSTESTPEQNLYTKEKWDDVQPLPDKVNDLRTTDQDPEFAQEDTNGTCTDLMAVVKTPHPLEESLRPAIFFKPLEDFFSFLYAKQPAETSQDNPNKIEGFSNKAQTCEVLHPSLLLMAAPFMLENRNNDEKMKNKDPPENLALAQSSASVLSEQEMSWKLYVPPTTLSAVLATAARLATSHGYFHWLPRSRKKL